MRKVFIAAAAACLLALPATAQEFAIDAAHSDISFSVRHLVSRTSGHFDKFEGVINLNAEKLEASTVELKIDAASINTGVGDRDNHLRSPDFFDVAKFPEITFKSSKIVKAGDTYNVTGTLTMHGVAKEITLPVTYNGQAKDPWGNTRAGFSLSTVLNRKDFGIVWNKTLDAGGLMLGEDVNVSINLETIAKK